MKLQKLIGDYVPALISRSDAEKINKVLDDISDRLEVCELKIEALKNNQVNLSSEVVSNLNTVGEVSRDLNNFLDTVDSTKSSFIAISTWASFFTVVGAVTYLLADYI